MECLILVMELGIREYVVRKSEGLFGLLTESMLKIGDRGPRDSHGMIRPTRRTGRTTR